MMLELLLSQLLRQELIVRRRWQLMLKTIVKC